MVPRPRWGRSVKFTVRVTPLTDSHVGGVGLCAIQIAKGVFKLFVCHNLLTGSASALGAKVIATAGTDTKLSICTKYGKADHAINYSQPGWQKEVLKITGGKGVGNYVLGPRSLCLIVADRCHLRPCWTNSRYGILIRLTSKGI